MDAQQLDAARGGFSLPSGLAVGLGIERTVAINGELVTQTRFAIADVRALTAEQAVQALAAMASVQLIRNGRLASPDTLPGAVPGPGPVAGAAAAIDTTLQSALGPALGATLIQNSLDQQRIESRTVIDASVNTLGSLKALNFSSTVLDSLARTALPH